MLSLPTGRSVVVSTAWPCAFNCAAPIDAPLAANVTVPLVTGEPPAITLAVSISLVPCVMELAEAASVVVVASGAGGVVVAALTVTDTLLVEIEAASLAEPT